MIARAVCILTILASTLPSCSAPPAKSTIKSDSYYLAQLRDSAMPEPNGAYFLSRVKELVDSIDIYDPAQVSKALSMHFLAHEKHFLYPPLCPNDYARKTSSLRAYTPESSWYAATPTGVHEMFVPRMFINPESKQGVPTFSYTIYREEFCTGRMDLRDSQQASIMFSNLAGFACITPSELVDQLHAKYQMATDGFSSYNVAGQSSDSFGRWLTFEFRFGAPCALSAQVAQSDKLGYRYNRAHAKFSACKEGAIKQLCKLDLPGDRFSQVWDDAVYKSCGGIGDFYDREPLTGAPSDGGKWVIPDRCPLYEK